MKKIVTCVAAMTAALILAACSPSAAPNSGANSAQTSVSGGGTVEATTLKALHAEALASQTVDPTQLAVLAQSDVKFADYEASINKAITCMKDENLQVDVQGTGRHNGVDIIGYTYAGVAGQIADDQVQIIANDCYEKFARYVDIFWQTSSPQVLKYAEARATALYDDMLACLKKYSVDVPEDATFKELDNASALLMTESSQAGAISKDCHEETGYHTWQP